MVRIFRQQLFDPDFAVLSGGNDIGEGSAAIDREIPGQGHRRMEADAVGGLNEAFLKIILRIAELRSA